MEVLMASTVHVRLTEVVNAVLSEVAIEEAVEEDAVVAPVSVAEAASGTLIVNLDRTRAALSPLRSAKEVARTTGAASKMKSKVKWSRPLPRKLSKVKPMLHPPKPLKPRKEKRIRHPRMRKPRS